MFTLVKDIRIVGDTDLQQEAVVEAENIETKASAIELLKQLGAKPVFNCFQKLDGDSLEIRYRLLSA